MQAVQADIQGVKKEKMASADDSSMDGAILEERAHKLALAEAEDLMDSSTLHILEFHLADEVYGFELSSVHKVCALHHLTPVPCTPAFVAGVINLHGRIVSVIDLGAFFTLPKTDIMNVAQVIVLQWGTMELGVLADEVQGIYPLSVRDLQGTLPVFSDRRVDYVKGIAENRMVVLDAGKILSDPSLIVDIT